MPEPPPLGYPVDSDPTPSQPPHHYIVGRSEEGPGYPRHRDYSDIHHGGTDGLIRGELSTLARALTVSQGKPMDGKLNRHPFISRSYNGDVDRYPCIYPCWTLPYVELQTHEFFPVGSQILAPLLADASQGF